MLVTELGNLMGRILLSPRRMSTVEIRARSLFCTPMSRIGASGAGFGPGGNVENGPQSTQISRNTGWELFSSGLHSLGRPCTGCTQVSAISQLRDAGIQVQSRIYKLNKSRIDQDGIEKDRRSKIEVDQSTGGGLPALCRDGLEDNSCQLRRGR